MTPFQCPNCGADLRVEDARQGYVVCRYCDSRIALTDERTPERNRAESERQAQLEEQRIARELELARARKEAAESELAVREAREKERQAELAWQKDNTRKCAIILAVSMGAWVISFIVFRLLRHSDNFFPLFITAAYILVTSSMMVPVFLVKTIASKWEETQL